MLVPNPRVQLIILGETKPWIVTDLVRLFGKRKQADIDLVLDWKEGSPVGEGAVVVVAPREDGTSPDRLVAPAVETFTFAVRGEGLALIEMPPAEAAAVVDAKTLTDKPKRVSRTA